MRAKNLLVFFAFWLLLSGWGVLGQQADDSPVSLQGRWGPEKLVVMTRNIYVGGNVDRVIEAQPEDLLAALMLTLSELQTTNFPERAVALAKEIKWWKPHLIGLQEVSVIDIHLPDFGMVFSLNYEEILMDTLKKMRLGYELVGKIQNVDAMVPLDSENYVRLIDFDAILARKDVKIKSVNSKNYDAYFSVPTLGVDILRGYVAVEAKVGRKTYKFVNTHLEPFVPEVKWYQAQELVMTFEGEALPIVMVGDFNADPNDPVYQEIVSWGYVDAWTKNQVHSNSDGFTAGFEPDLSDPYDTLEKRIDLIWVRNNPLSGKQDKIGPVIAFVVGDSRRDRTPSGLWPSDHAGVVASLKIPVR